MPGWLLEASWRGPKRLTNLNREGGPGQCRRLRVHCPQIGQLSSHCRTRSVYQSASGRSVVAAYLDLSLFAGVTAIARGSSDHVDCEAEEIGVSDRIGMMRGGEVRIGDEAIRRFTRQENPEQAADVHIRPCCQADYSSTLPAEDEMTLSFAGREKGVLFLGEPRSRGFSGRAEQSSSCRWKGSTRQVSRGPGPPWPQSTT
jgi:hypothetical protein